MNCKDWQDYSMIFDSDLSNATVDILNNARYLYFNIPDEFEVIHLNSITLEYSDAKYDPEKYIDSYGYLNDGIYHVTHNAGFFSNCSTTLRNLARIYPIPIQRINTKLSFSHFKDNPNDDPWLDYFEEANNIEKDMTFNWLKKGLYHHTRYEKINFQETQLLIEHYFSPSEKVRERVDHLTKKYGIDYSKIIAVNFRGTDKSTEIKPQPFEAYAIAAQKLIDKNPACRVLIQTDQTQFRDYLSGLFGENSFFFSELPTTEGDMGIHYINKNDKLDFAINLLAVVQIMAKCKYLITHTGNVAYWTLLFRGNSENTIQL